MLTSLARTCYQRRRRVVAIWIALLVGAITVASTFGGEFRNEFSIPGSEADEAERLLVDGGFPGPAGERGQIVFAAVDGVEVPAVRTAVERLLGTVEAEVDGVAIGSPYAPGAENQIAPGGRVAYADVEFGDASRDEALDRASAIVELRDATGFPAGVQVELGGELFFEEPEFSSEAIGLLGAVVILLVAFGSVLAMGLPIVTALFGMGCGFAIVMLAALVIDVPDFTPAAVAMVTIGVGIDYALFLVTRYREELASGLTPQDAVVRSMATAGRAVLFAGTTVVVALLGLLLVGLAAIGSLAVAVSAGVLMVMLASLTLVPALLGFAGRGIDRLSVRRRPSPQDESNSVWHRWSRMVQRRPALVGAVGLIVLLVLAVPTLSMRLGFADAGNRPETDTSRRAYDLVAEGFGPGHNGPLFLAVDLTGDAERDRRVLDRTRTAVAADPGVASASPPVVGSGVDVAWLRVVPTTAPQDEATSRLVHRLRDDVLPEAISDSDARVLVGGAVAAAIDAADFQASRMPLFIGAVLLVSFLVLMAVFRSVLVAAKAVLLNLLSIGAAYGLIVLVFQWGWGGSLLGFGEPGPVEAWAPMMLFAIVFGLSMDYEVFLLSRIKEEYDRTGDNATAVADGLARTARLITAAAAIMIVVFGGFVLSVDRALQLFGFGLAMAILVDVTVVRLLLVPAAMELLGDRNWWLPRQLESWLPQIATAPAPAPAVGLRRTPRLDERPSDVAGRQS